MKKISALTLPFFTYLTVTVPAFAQTTLNPCPENPSGTRFTNFNPLCLFSIEGKGGILGKIVALAFVIAIIIALFFLIYGGIKWITSGGDKAGVEGARNMIVAALVGLVIVFLSYLILNFILGLFGLGTLQNLQIPNFAGN